MYFREYGSDEATLKEWSRQLSIINGGKYGIYPTVENTLQHWKSELAINTGINSWKTYPETNTTIVNWKDQLNRIYNN